jgi:hypothetical protein
VEERTAMQERYEISSSLKELIEHAEKILDCEIHLQRQPDSPPKGLVLDRYSFDSPRNVLVFSPQQIGMLKDFVIGHNCIRMTLKGTAHGHGDFQVLSFDESCATLGMEQIYLDILKDEKTRHLDLAMKKKLMFYLYLLFHETICDIPWSILANIVISKKCPVMRSAQVYFLMKESMRDMHDLVSFKDYIPRRYFVMHNAMFYARDLLLAEVLSEMKLNPMINIPEFKKFKNLNLMEMLTNRWMKSLWYQTKLVGDVMVQILKDENIHGIDTSGTDENYYRIFQAGVALTKRWISFMQLDKYYLWSTPAHQREALKNQDKIELAARVQLFGVEV